MLYWEADTKHTISLFVHLVWMRIFLYSIDVRKYVRYNRVREIVMKVTQADIIIPKEV